ncbi:MAG: nuclear transport factor 2 family protein [Phyllobacterium sp.]|uniref:nuclear transport factor 2 family protein n=1 Tax=Phyllobacterium sp. TaxID=1871046 RepID=UPI0030F090EF
MAMVPTQGKAHFLAVPTEDFTAIVDALYRFGAGQDLRDRQLFESAFAADAVLDFTAVAAKLGVTIPVFEGRQAIVDTILTTTGILDTTHSITNPRVKHYDGSRATLFALIEAQHLPRGDHSRHLLLKNVLDVDLASAGDHWVIERMHFENAWRVGDADVLFKPSVTSAGPV